MKIIIETEDCSWTEFSFEDAANRMGWLFENCCDDFSIGDKIEIRIEEIKDEDDFESEYDENLEEELDD